MHACNAFLSTLQISPVLITQPGAVQRGSKNNRMFQVVPVYRESIHRELYGGASAISLSPLLLCEGIRPRNGVAYCTLTHYITGGGKAT